MTEHEQLRRENEELRRDLKNVLEYVERIRGEAHLYMVEIDDKLADLCAFVCDHSRSECFKEGEHPWVCENWKWRGDENK